MEVSDDSQFRSRRWLLRGAAVGAAAAGGAIALRAPEARATTPPGVAGWLNVADYGAVGDGTTDNTTAFSNALSAASSLGGATVLVPPGTYLVNGTLTLHTGTVLAGASRTSSIIKQAATTGPLLHALDQRYLSVTDLTLQGPGSGTGSGVYFDQSTGSAVAGLEIRDVNVVNFCGDAVFLNTPITSTLTNVRCQISPSSTSAGYAFHVLSGTSLVFNACYANGAFLTGYYLDGLHYSSLDACAADGNNRSYYLNDCESVTLTGSGCESNVIGTAPYGGYGFVINGGQSNSLDGCRSYKNPSIAFWATGSARHTTLTSCDEVGPATGATASYKIDSGSTAVVTNPGWTTSPTFASGTTYLIQSTGPTTY